jgi:hypothetical protein
MRGIVRGGAPKSTAKVTVARVEERHWGPDDDYNVVPEFQVFDSDGFKKGTPVRVTVEKITEGEYQNFFRSVRKGGK